MLDYTEELKNIATCFREAEHDFFKLSSAINNFKSIVNKYCTMDLDSPDNRADLAFDNGIAIGAKWAALCLDDIVRTKQFIRGIFKAIEDKLKTKKEPLHILYAGSGPYATLILPVLAYYQSDIIKVTLLDINKTSLDQAVNLLRKLGFEDHIYGIINEDVTQCTIENANIYDIVISETMQLALLKEQQVPIMLNLVKQISTETTIIPSSINLHLALFNSSVKFPYDEQLIRLEYLGEIVKFNKDYINKLNNRNNPNNKLWSATINIPNKIPREYDRLAITTEIEVYDGVSIGFNESSLTIAHCILQTSRIPSDCETLKCDYHISQSPGYKYHWN